jgi:hypothetical protein
MKYGGQGGWRAVKRFNRDARIASGQSPYGYRARYDGSGRKDTNREQQAHPQSLAGLLWATWREYPIISTFLLFPLFLIVFLWDYLERAFKKLENLKSSRQSHDSSVVVQPIADSVLSDQADEPGRCLGLTKRGTRCKYKATNEKYCARHSPQKLT